MDSSSKTARSSAYLEFVRSQPCCVSGSTENVQAAHVGRGGGVGLKASDFSTVPMTAELHAEQHQLGIGTFRKKYGVSFNAEIARLLHRFWVGQDLRLYVES